MPSSSKERIAEAAAAGLARHGLANLTVSHAAALAGVSTALVHYHFDTKQQLIVAAAEGLAAARATARSAALAGGRGLETLDELWRAVRESAADGTERAWAELATLAASDTEVRATLARARRAEDSALAARVEALLAELGAPQRQGVEELAPLIRSVLDGVALALLTGEPDREIRAAYDAFWLLLISAPPPSAPR
jgi:AcrR family transcriptional regulator